MPSDFRWSRIDPLEIGSYPFLESGDLCFYYLERSRGTWRESQANSIVSNFQKDIEKHAANAHALFYKDQAIEYFAERISLLIGRKNRACPLVLVPMVTSKPKSHRWFDDRLFRTANKVRLMRPGEVAVCDILDLDSEMRKSKLGGERDPQSISGHILVASPEYPQADTVFLIDDVITTGGHFAACRDAVKPLFPNARIVGVFLARQIRGVKYD